MATKLYVGSLSYQTSDEELRKFFESAGMVVSASVIMDRFSGTSKGFGFVEMATENEAKKAIDELNGKSLGDRTIVVQEARPQENRDRSSGASGAGYGDRRPRW